MTVNEALCFIIKHGNPQAVAYAQVAQEYPFDDEELAYQLQYVLVNFTHCRTPGHREVRQRLNEFVLDYK
jgi:hypothetical protein